jgi:hypothetical protein
MRRSRDGVAQPLRGYSRRRILHINVTSHPTSSWIAQQLREAFPFESAPRFLVFDRDGKYGLEVPQGEFVVLGIGMAQQQVVPCLRDLRDLTHTFSFVWTATLQVSSQFLVPAYAISFSPWPIFQAGHPEVISGQKSGCGKLRCPSSFAAGFGKITACSKPKAIENHVIVGD